MKEAIPVSFGFATAIGLLRENKQLCREGWNGKKQWLELQLPDEFSKMTEPYIYMVIEKEKTIRIPWLASQSDILSYDWKVYE